MKTIHIEIPDRVINMFRLIVGIFVIVLFSYFGYQGYKFYNRYQAAIDEHDNLIVKVKNLESEKNQLTKSNDECFLQQDRDKAQIEALVLIQKAKQEVDTQQ